MDNRGADFKLKRPKFGIFLAVLYFVVAAGFTAYIFMPKIADASSEERLFMPSISLIARVKDIEQQGRSLIAPDTIAGAYKSSPRKTVIIGHSSTIFKDLKDLSYGDNFTFDNQKYEVKRIEIIEKSTIDMSDVVKDTPVKTVVLMTCYGEPLGGQDYTHRLIITAEEV